MKTAAQGSIGSATFEAHQWWIPIPVASDINVVWVDLTPHAGREKEALPWLDEAERSRWEKYLPDPRRRSVLCRAALRAVLCAELNCLNRHLSFEESGYGKPFALVEGQPASINFNVSHSGRQGLIAFTSAGRVGVDIEEVVPRRKLESLIEVVMGQDEREELSKLQGKARLRQFFRLWTCKEALIKALGTGFSTDISGFQVPANVRSGETKGTFRFPSQPGVTWQLEDIGRDGFAAALAYDPVATTSLSSEAGHTTDIQAPSGETSLSRG